MVYKCKVCGGDFLPEEILGKSVCRCRFCNTLQSIPTVNEEKLKFLHRRANELRLNNRFDDAINAYENIIVENPKDAEAYFCLLLCRYGIEYVRDLDTNKVVATCHRLQTNRIIEEPEYRYALEYADSEAKEYYINEAASLDKILMDALRISQNEEKFDIFISCKLTDENKCQTIDSYMAKEFYDLLTKEGYKVFLSSESLKDKLGSNYEPIIYSALRSSRAMILIGTREEYIKAPWVVNEWSRYLSFLEGREDAYFIACYKGFNLELLPPRLRPLHSIDLCDPNYKNDVLKFIESKLGKRKLDEKSILREALELIMADKPKPAKALLNKLLKQNSKCSMAYLDLLLIEMSCHTVEELCLIPNEVEKSPNYLEAKRWINYETITPLEKIDEAINKFNQRLNEEANKNKPHEQINDNTKEGFTDSFKSNLRGSLKDILKAEGELLKGLGRKKPDEEPKEPNNEKETARVSLELTPFERECNKYLSKIQDAFSFNNASTRDAIFRNKLKNITPEEEAIRRLHFQAMGKNKNSSYYKYLLFLYYKEIGDYDNALRASKDNEDYLDMSSLISSVRIARDEKFKLNLTKLLLEPYYRQALNEINEGRYEGALAYLEKCDLRAESFKSAPRDYRDYYKDSYQRYLEISYNYKLIYEKALASLEMNSNYYAFKHFDAIRGYRESIIYVCELSKRAYNEIFSYADFLYKNKRYKEAMEVLVYISYDKRAAELYKRIKPISEKGVISDCSKYIFDLYRPSGSYMPHSILELYNPNKEIEYDYSDSRWVYEE